MKSGISKSVNKVTFRVSTPFHDNKIKAIDKQKEESLRWHISKIEKLRNKKWKSLEGIPPPPPRPPIRLENREAPPDIEVTRATSFYAWDENNPSQTKSIITSIKPPADLAGSSNSGEVSFTEVTKFYKEAEMETYDNSNNTNTLLRLYSHQDEQGADVSTKVRRTHIYIPHVNKEGRVVLQDTPPANKAIQTDSFDSITERDSKQTNLERFKESIEKRAPKLGRAPRAFSFPETNSRNRRPSILSLVNKIEKTKTEITAMRLRSNSRLSKALRKIGEESRVIPERWKTEVEDEAFLISLEDDSSIPNEQCVARLSSILEREDRAQDTTLFIKGSDIQARRQASSELKKRRDELQPLLMTDMEDHHYVRRVGSREEERHDVTCGCNKYHGLGHSYSEVEV